MNMRQIAEETGMALSKVGTLLKGIEPAKTESASTIKEEPPRRPQLMAVMIRQEDAAKIYALAIDEGFNSVEEFLERMMLPWYRVKRDFEWKLKTKIEPKKFQLYIENCMADSLELQQLKEQWTKQLQSKQPGTPMPIAMSHPGGS